MKSKGRDQSWERQVARELGVAEIEWHYANHHNHTVEVELETKFPSDVIRKKMMQRGWDLRRKPICPECVAEMKTAKTNDNKQKEEHAIMAESNVTPIAPPDNSAAARRGQREAMQWIEESFEMVNEASGRYKSGMSDVSIAKETGISEHAVAKLREQFYGTIHRPREIDDLLSKITEMKAANDKTRREAAAAIEANKIAIEALEKRVETLIKNNGWL